jgi:sulfoxide reductase heme-binding subunit YedZ
MTNPFDYTWWLASRAAGIVGFTALGIVAILGLVSALKLVTPATAARMRPWHERLAITGLVAISLHGLLLVADPWLHPGVVGVLVPFTMGYRPLWTGLGIIAFYCLAAFGLSFYQRRRIGARRWRSAHRFASIAFVLGGIHALMAGTDARSPLLLGLIVGFGVIIGALVAARAMGLRAKRATPARRARPPKRTPDRPLPTGGWFD